MAGSGSFKLYSEKGLPWEGRVDYVLTDDAANNQTEVFAKLYTYKTNGVTSGSNEKDFYPRITVDEVDYSGEYYATEYGIENLRASNTFYVKHNSDGKKTITIEGAVRKYAGSPATTLDDSRIVGSKTIVLTNYITGYTLTYNANGGSGAPSSVSNITSATILSTVPTRSGYDFLGWSTSSSAASASYVAGDPISLSSDTTLYAVWRKFYIVTYDANGGSNAPSPDKKIDGETLTLGSGTPTPPAPASGSHTVTFNSNGGTCDQDMVMVTNITTYEFANWNTSSNGYGIPYQPGGSYKYNDDVTLYAQYTHDTTYNSVALPTPSRNNYDFLGWSTDEYDTSGIMGEYSPTDDVTLYAIWKIKGQVYICDNNGDFSPYQVLIYDGSGWNQYIPYVYTESGWEIYSG